MQETPVVLKALGTKPSRYECVPIWRPLIVHLSVDGKHGLPVSERKPAVGEPSAFNLRHDGRRTDSLTFP